MGSRARGRNIWGSGSEEYVEVKNVSLQSCCRQVGWIALLELWTALSLG